MGSCTPWFAPMGRSKTTRSLARATARSMNQRPSPMHSAAMRMRSAFHESMTQRKPLPSSPTMWSAANLQVAEGDGVGVVVHHHAQRAHVDAVPHRAQVDEEEREPARAVLQLLQRRRSREHQHEVRLQYAGDEDLFPVDDVGVAVADGGGPDARGVRAGLGFRDGEGLQAQLAGRDARQVGALEGVARMSEQDAHHVDLRVGGPRVGAAAVDLLQHDARLREAHAAAAVLGGNHGGEPPRAAELPDELLREGPLPVEPAPVVAAVALAHGADARADAVPVLRGLKVHTRPPMGLAGAIVHRQGEG